MLYINYTTINKNLKKILKNPQIRSSSHLILPTKIANL